MRISIRNIGKVGAASVTINGITVIAGENNTGKSTVGRSLFAVFNSFYNIQKQIEAERVQNANHLIALMYHSLTHRMTRVFDTKEIAQNIVTDIDFYRNDVSAIQNMLIRAILQYDEHFEKYIEDSNVEKFIFRIREGLSISDRDIFKSVLEKKLDIEFNGQINNIFNGGAGEITLSIKDTDIIVAVEGNRVRDIAGEMDCCTEVVYMDDPFVLDEMGYSHYGTGNDSMDHRGHLRKKLDGADKANIVEEIVAGNKLGKIYHKISSVCSGEIVRMNRSRFGYQRKDTDQVLDVKNLSTGFKTFAVLKTLLLNSTIEYNGIIILDEPEIHLHPEWQLLFAETIVLIQKEFGVHILLNTHSPYFLRAIQVYSAKYEVADSCKYYLSEMIGNQAEISDVTDCIEKIYVKLSYPLQRLEDERWESD